MEVPFDLRHRIISSYLIACFYTRPETLLKAWPFEFLKIKEEKKKQANNSLSIE